MDRLIENLVDLMHCDRELERAWEVEASFRAAHRDDSRVRLLTTALRMGVPRRLIAGDAVCMLTRLLAARHFDQAAAEWAVAAWSAAVGVTDAMLVPTLAPAPNKTVEELAAEIVDMNDTIADRQQKPGRFSRNVMGKVA